MKFLVNTRYFSEAANDYIKNKGVYTKATPGSREFMEYWKIQKRRCLEGYSVGGIKITGKHYFYLNFCPIMHTNKRGGLDEFNKKKNDGWNVLTPKQEAFPSFWLIDYEWWWAKEISTKGMLAKDVAKLEIPSIIVQDYLHGKHLVCVKTRRAGMSYKEAADGVYNYNFIPKSKSYYFASLEEYLTSDGILNKVVSYLNHLDKNTQNYWKKNRMEHNSLSTMHWKASYEDKNGDIRGYESEILGLIVNNPNKVRGKDGIKITYEEAGSFKGLLKALEISLPSVQEGKKMTGQVSVFGTGGEEGDSIEGLTELITNPDVYNFMEFKNIYEEGMEDSRVGYFIPCTHIFEDFMDVDGNIDIQGALDYDESERERRRRSGDPKKVDLRIAEFPRTIDEALSRAKTSIFPVVEIKEHIKDLKKSKAVLASIRYGELAEDPKTNKVVFINNSKLTPILNYPHGNNDDLKGAVTINYPPVENYEGKVDGQRYQIVVDPYYKDGAENRRSLWAAYVMDIQTDDICASYIGRPELLDTCYLNTVLLSKMYGFAKIQCEIQGGGEDFFRFLRRKNLLYLADYQPLITSTKEIQSEKNRSYFMTVTTESKKVGLSGYANYVKEIVGLREDGTPIRRFQTYTDLGLLLEMANHNAEGNFDRISAKVLWYFMKEEKANLKMREQESGQDSYDELLLSTFETADSVPDKYIYTDTIDDDMFEM